MDRDARRKGVNGVAAGLALIACFLLSTPEEKGTLLFVAAAIMVLPVSLALVLVPSRYLLVPQEAGVQSEADEFEPSWTLLGRGFQLLSFLAAVAAYASLKTGN